ncbi:MAG TPA: helix-turn-helix transcriptional regulator [Acidimicrobiales bacterium]|nr:helix-turn-helix transcriptional regulator [Acidimicrobiales bacterium]
MIDPTVLARRVREERVKAGLSLSQLAQRSGLTKAYLVRLENQAANPSLEVTGQIAEALDLTIADLLGGPVIRFVGDDADISPSLRAFADQAQLSSTDLRMLASIRWRHGEQPQTSDRWEYVYRSLVMSRQIDNEGSDQ